MLDKLSERSIEFALATGRNFTELVSMFGESALSMSLICCDGAYILSDSKCISSFPIDKKLFDQFFALIENKNVFAIEFHSIGNTYIAGGNFSIFNKEKKRLSILTHIKSTDEISDDIFKITVIGKNLDPFRIGSTRLSYFSNDIAEYVSDKATKLSGVNILCSHFSTNISNVTYFGDSENDRDVLRACPNSYTTYCADKTTFQITKNHTRDVIGTIIRLASEHN